MIFVHDSFFSLSFRREWRLGVKGGCNFLLIYSRRVRLNDLLCRRGIWKGGGGQKSSTPHKRSAEGPREIELTTYELAGGYTRLEEKERRIAEKGTAVSSGFDGEFLFSSSSFRRDSVCPLSPGRADQAEHSSLSIRSPSRGFLVLRRRNFSLLHSQASDCSWTPCGLTD